MIETVERKFKFEYPELFHQINKNGGFGFGQSGPGWYENYYQKSRKNPSFLLFVNDFELLELDRVEKLIPKIKSKSGIYSQLVPFGKTGAGDLYCFAYDADKFLDCICLFNKRTDESIKLAKTLDDFIFRELLSAVVDIDPEDFQDDEKSFKEDLQAMLASHNSYLSKHRFSILEKLYSEPIFDQDDDTFGALQMNEFFSILKREINFDGFGEKFSEFVFFM